MSFPLPEEGFEIVLSITANDCRIQLLDHLGEFAEPQVLFSRTFQNTYHVLDFVEQICKLESVPEGPQPRGKKFIDALKGLT